MYEHVSKPPLSRRAFINRLARTGGYGLWLLAFSLALGMAGYRWIAHYTWTDAFLNASMLLGGMGPVGTLSTTSAKIFAGFYALYAGMVFLVVFGLMLTPVFHRILHKFHFEHHESR